MKRMTLLVMLLAGLFATSLATTTFEAQAQNAEWTLKYQCLNPKFINIEKVVTVPDPENPDLPKIEVRQEKYWYQVIYLKNPTEEKITVPFESLLLVDSVDTVEDPDSGDEIDVSNLMPAFKGEKPNYIVNEKTGNRLVIPGTAHKPVYDSVVHNKIIEDLRIKPIQTHKYKKCYNNGVIVTKPLEKYENHLDLVKPFEAEQVRQFLLVFKDLDPGFDRLVYRYSGLTNKYEFKTEEDKLTGKGSKRILRLTYTRPGDEYDTEDVNPEPADLFHITSPEWILEPIR
ncbi:MAG: hypothetical protein U5N86_08855 [Planctomycetota bacterium]|nr:hypothetical protein [Planctomycetota bacterium]